MSDIKTRKENPALIKQIGEYLSTLDNEDDVYYFIFAICDTVKKSERKNKLEWISRASAICETVLT